MARGLYVATSGSVAQLRHLEVLSNNLARARSAGFKADRATFEAANPQLSDHVIHDLNETPELPYADASFDSVLNAVSVQYLQRPVEVFASIARVLRPGGRSIVSMSHRCFPTKAIQAFQYMGGTERMRLVETYHELAGGFDAIESNDRSPDGADPLWIVTALRSALARR